MLYVLRTSLDTRDTEIRINVCKLSMSGIPVKSQHPESWKTMKTEFKDNLS